MRQKIIFGLIMIILVFSLSLSVIAEDTSNNDKTCSEDPSICKEDQVCKEGSCEDVDADIYSYESNSGKTYARSDIADIFTTYDLKNTGGIKWCFLTEVKYVDPDGEAPNKSDATNPEFVTNSLAATPDLVALRDIYKTQSANRYFYTDQYGWIDIRHFADAAQLSRNLPSSAVMGLGFLLESFQWLTEWGDDYRSGFSPEDLPSNSAGSDFGRSIGDQSLATAFEAWAEMAGAHQLCEIAHIFRTHRQGVEKKTGPHSV